jgi:UDP:flavonoid glycosyltransferase YjiC (YdhE family)
MRVLIATLGSFGDLLPLLSITRAMIARGYEVSIAGSSNFEPYVRGIGVDFSSVSASERVQRPTEDARQWDASRIWHLGMERVLLPAMRPTYEWARDRARHDSDIVLTRPGVFGARFAAEKLGIRVCTVYMSPESLNVCDPTSTASRSRGISADEVFGPAINAYRRELGMAPVDHICSRWLHSPQHGLGLFPDWLCARQSYWPAQITTTGFVTYDGPLGSLGSAPTEALEAFLRAGRPPIVFTPGTGMSRAKDFFKESLATCASLGARAIFLTHHHAHIPPRLPPWAMHADYIPMKGFLGRTLALVHAGGIGTCAQAIRAGIPQLLVPTVGDQFGNSLHMESLGLGVSVPMKEYEEKIVTRKLTELLSAASVQRACRLYASQFASNNPLETTCDFIESLG